MTKFCLLEKLPEKYVDNGWGYVTCDWQQIPDNINCCYQLSVPHTYHYPCYLLYTLSDRTFFLNASLSLRVADNAIMTQITSDNAITVISVKYTIYAS